MAADWDDMLDGQWVAKKVIYLVEQWAAKKDGQ
jgi:hypothetical protein